MGLPRFFVYDVEIAKSVEEAGGWGNHKEMGLAVCSIFDLQTNLTWHYDVTQLEELKQLFLEADLRVSFNGKNFDQKVLAGQGIEFEYTPEIDYDIWKSYFVKECIEDEDREFVDERIDDLLEIIKKYEQT